MIEWASPWWFLALPVALAAPWLARRPRLAVSDVSILAQRSGVRLLLARLPQLLASLALACLVAALARPQLVNRERVVESEGIDIVLALDTSGSMEAEDFRLGGRAANRLEVAKAVVQRFVEARPDDRIGLVVFGEAAFTQVPLTLDHDGFATLLDLVGIGMAGRRATAIGDAIAVASRRLEGIDAPSKVIILLTDGRNNAGQVAPLEAARAAAALGVRIYTIGVGTEGGGGGFFGMFGGRAELDEKTLTAIARETDGRYFRATDTHALEKVYATIDQLEKSTAESKVYVHTQERYHPWLAAGLALLLVQAVLGETVLRRLP